MGAVLLIHGVLIISLIRLAIMLPTNRKPLDPPREKPGLKNYAFQPVQANLFPLLHVTIARGKFIQSHDYFCDQVGANYFEYVGAQIADIFLQHKDDLHIWI
jgi:hypothetical protein